jgi:putative transposase
MVHPYPRHCDNFSYRGRYRYFLTFPTAQRVEAFTIREVVEVALAAFLRAANDLRFEILAYCFMPDHLHLVVAGLDDDSDCKAFIKLAKQYSGYSYAAAHPGARLFQRYGHDRIIRDDVELWVRIRYVMANPVVAGLVNKWEDYPFLGGTLVARGKPSADLPAVRESSAEEDLPPEGG